MALERTLSIIKPDAVQKNVIGEIYSRFEKGGLKIIAARMKQLSRAEAEGFYAVHRERPFFNALVEFMISGPVMIQALEGDNAIAKNRELMGATDPKKADGARSAPTLPIDRRHAVHGSVRRKPRQEMPTSSLRRDRGASGVTAVDKTFGLDRRACAISRRPASRIAPIR